MPGHRSRLIRPRVVLGLTLLVVFGCFSTPVFAWPDGFQKRIKLDVDNSQVTSALSNFPVLVQLEDGVNFDFADIQSGDDIRFFDSTDVVELNYEIEGGAWDGTAAINAIWVNVPSIPASPTSAYFYFYFDHVAATPTTLDPLDTWSPEYTSIFHFADDPTGGGAKMVNSVTGAAEGTANGSMVAADVVAGIAGTCLDFDGTDDHIGIPSASLFTTGDISTTDFTLSTWVKLRTKAGSQRQVILCQEGTNGFVDQARDASPVDRFATSVTGTEVNPATGTIVLNTWHHIAIAVTQGTPDNVDIYFDGILVGNTTGTIASETGVMRVGRHKTPAATNEEWNGFIDEVWASSTALSDEWIATHYLAVTDDLLTFNPIEEPDADTTITASATLAEPATVDSVLAAMGTGVNIFDFKITDLGTTDPFATKVEEIVIDIAGSADAGEHTWYLNGPDVTLQAGVVAGTTGTQTLTFSGLDISVENGVAETYTIRLSAPANPTGTIDGTIFLLSLDDASFTQPDDVNTSFFEAGQALVTNGTGVTYDVAASGLSFITQPGSTQTIGTAFNVVLEFADANGNRDLDVTGDVVTASRSDDSTDVGTATAASGVASFTGADAITLAAPTAGGLTLIFTDDAGNVADLSGEPATSNEFNLAGTMTVTDVEPAIGPVTGGTTVVITGTNLGAVSFVSFNGRSASIAGTTATTVTVVTPGQTADLVADIFLTDGVSSVTESDGFVYGSPATSQPQLSNIIPSSGSVDGGNVVTLVGTNLGGVTTVTFGGIEADTETVTPTLITLFAPAASSAGIVSVTVSNGAASDTLTSAYTYISGAKKSKGKPATLLGCALERDAVKPLLLWMGLAMLGWVWCLRRVLSRRL